MSLEITCDKLLQEISVLLSKNNPELALLYFHAVLHTAERDKLSAEWIDKLITTLPQVINLLAMDKQIALYERLLKLAESKKLAPQIAGLHMSLGEIHEKGITHAVKPAELRTAISKPERYSNHITALANYVKAQRTLKQVAVANDNSVVGNNQRAMTRVETNCHFDLLLGHSKSQFIEAKSKKQTDVVAVLRQFARLATRLQSSGLIIEAISVYQQALELLSTQQSFYEKTCLNEVDETFLFDGLLQLSEANPNLTVSQPLWQQNLNQLRELRETFKKRVVELYKTIDSIRYDVNQIQQLEQLQADLAFAMKEFIVVLFKQAEALLGAAPCAYSVLGLGSIARGDMTPYSDLESILLVEQDISKNSDARNYFETLLRLVEFQVHSLGESFDDNPGFHLDKECHPLIMPELVGTPEQILQRFKLTDLTGINTEQDGNGLLAYTLLRPTLVHGSASLFDKYQALVNQALNQNTETRQAKAREFLRVHVKTFQEETRKSFDESDQFKKGCQVKKNLLGPLTHVLVDLAFYHHFADVNLVDILSELSEEQKILATEFAQTCRSALAELNLLRLNAHLQSNQQNDGLVGTSTLQVARLQAIFNGICAALYDQPERLLTSVNKPYHPIINSLSEMIITNTPTVESVPTVTVAVNPSNTITRRARSNASAGMPVPTSKIQQVRALSNAVCYLSYSQHPSDNSGELICEAYQVTLLALRSEFIKTISMMECWFLGSPSKQHALKQLAYQPNPDGWYPAMEEENNQWLKVFSTLFQTNATAEMIQAAKQKNAVVVRCGNLHGGLGVNEYLLQDAVRDQLFEKNGQPKAKPNNQRGRHVVLKVIHQGQIFWFKFTPEQSGTEYAVNRLARHIGDQGTPMTQVIKICHGTQSEGIAVQVAPHVEGLTLEETLQKYPERLLQLDPSSFAETLLRVLLTNPEDDKGDDYFLSPNEAKKESFRLKRIDNERAFYDPTEMKGMLKKNEALQVKSMLYCLQQMQQPLSQAVLSRFLELDPMLVLQGWLNELQLEHQRYQSLFTDKDIETHFGIKEPGPCLLGIPIAEGLIEELLTRLDSMQQVVRLAKEQGRAVIGMDLLKVVQPTLADFYADAFKAIPDSKPEAALQRFDLVTKNLYQRSNTGVRESRIQSAKAITQSLRLKTKLSTDVVLQMVRGKQNSPTQGLETLQTLQSKKLEDIKQGLLSENSKEAKTAITQFQKLVVRQRLQLFKELVDQHQLQPLTASQQITLLQAMAGIPFHELSLQTFRQVLTDKLLQPILENAGAHLIKLDLRDCVLVTDSTIQLIAECCPNLSYLGLETKNKVRVINGTFLKLNVLDVNDCAELTRIEIDAPQLALLKAKSCRELRSIKTSSLLLSEVDLTDCVSLEGAGIIELSQFAGHLRKVKLKNSAITHPIFRETYSFLAMLPLHHCSDVCVKQLDEQLRHGFKERFGDSEKDPMLLDPHSANQLYEKINQRFELAETVLKTANNLITGIIVNRDNRVIRTKLLGCVALLGYKSEIILNILLTPLLKDSDWQRLYAATAVGQVAMHNPTKVQSALLPLLKDSKEDVRYIAAEALHEAAKYVKLPAEVLSALLPLLKDSESDVRKAATWALGEAATQVKLPTEVLLALLPLLKDSKQYMVRSAAAEVLAQAAMHNPTEVMSVLLPLLEDWAMREVVVEVMGQAVTRIKLPARVLSALLPLLKDLASNIRAVAVEAMDQAVKHNLTKVLSALLSLLKDSDEYMREAAVEAVGQVLTQIKLPAEVLSAMLPLLKDSECDVRKAAAFAVGQAATQVKLPTEALSALLPLLKDSECDVRKAAAFAVGQTATQVKLPAEALSALLLLLKDSEWVVRSAAAMAVGQEAMHNLMEVLSVLLPLLKDSNVDVREATGEALGNCISENAFKNDIKSALRGAKLIATNNLSLRTSIQRNSSTNKTTTSS
jgi:HEAT repeat protein